MKILVFALVLSGALNARSLNVGVDVLPEAFTFAASRVGFAPNLRLASCNASSCLWDLGDGVAMAADHPDNSLTINRIEAKLDPARGVALKAVERFEKACLAIVVLVAPGAPPADQRSTAKAISAASGSESVAELQVADGSVRFYGVRPPDGHDAGSAFVARCGAFPSS